MGDQPHDTGKVRGVHLGIVVKSKGVREALDPRAGKMLVAFNAATGRLPTVPSA